MDLHGLRALPSAIVSDLPPPNPERGSPEILPSGAPPRQGLPVLARFFVAYFIILPGYIGWILGLVATFAVSASMGAQRYRGPLDWPAAFIAPAVAVTGYLFVVVGHYLDRMEQISEPRLVVHRAISRLVIQCLLVATFFPAGAAYAAKIRGDAWFPAWAAGCLIMVLIISGIVRRKSKHLKTNG